MCRWIFLWYPRDSTWPIISCWKCIPFFGWMIQFLYLVIKSWSSVFYMVHSAGETFQWDFYKTYWSFYFWLHVYLVFLCCFYLFIIFNFCILNCSLGLHLKFVLFKFIQVFIHVLFEYPELLTRFITVLFKFRVLSFTQAILIGNNYRVWWSLTETHCLGFSHCLYSWDENWTSRLGCWLLFCDIGF